MLEFKARTNLKLIVTDHQMEILVGSLLGDGYIYPQGKIQLEHTLKYLPYLNWKYKNLSSLAYGKPRVISRFDQRTGKVYTGVRFWLRQYFRPLRRMFYPSGKKIVPRNISKYFTRLALAVWYMDDGNLYKARHLKMATDGFDCKSRRLLQELLLTKFGIESSIQASGKLRISSKSLDKFFELVKPYIHSSMMYKVP